MCVCEWVCYDLYYLDHDWRTSSQLGPSSGPFCSFLRCNSNTSKILKQHCKHNGFGNMSLLEGPQIGANLTLSLHENSFKNNVKHRVYGPPAPMFLVCIFHVLFFLCKPCFFTTGCFTSTGALFLGI